MHLKEDDLYNLAIAEYSGKVLTDIQGSQKWHLGECRECYKKFCMYITMLDLIGYEDDTENEEEYSSETQLSNVFLQIQLAGAVLSSVNTKMENNLSCWNFIHMPKMAASRGNKGDRETDIYISMESEYSQIRQEGQQLIIQLDQDIFPTDQLGVRYTEDGKNIVRKFIYNEMSECYEVVIDRSGKDNKLLVEVMLLENIKN